MLIVVSTILSSFIAAYVIQLYVRRAEYQDENIDDIRMDAGEEDWREREKLSSKATSKTSAGKSLTKTTTKTEKSDSGWGSNSRYKGLSWSTNFVIRFREHSQGDPKSKHTLLNSPLSSPHSRLWLLYDYHPFPLNYIGPDFKLNNTLLPDNYSHP